MFVTLIVHSLSSTLSTPSLSPRFLNQTHFPIACQQYYCMLNYDNPYTKYFLLYQVTLILIIPTIILCYTYTAICTKLWHVLSSKGRSELTAITTEPR